MPLIVYKQKQRISLSISHQCYLMNTTDLLTLYRLYGEHADASSLCRAFELLLAAQELLSPGEQTLQDQGRAYISHGSSGCVLVASKASFCACTDLSAMAVCHWASEQPVISLCCMMQERSSPSMAKEHLVPCASGLHPNGVSKGFPKDTQAAPLQAAKGLFCLVMPSSPALEHIGNRVGQGQTVGPVCTQRDQKPCTLPCCRRPADLLANGAEGTLGTLRSA